MKRKSDKKSLVPKATHAPMSEVMRKVDAQIGRAVVRLSDR